jgi:hypothetical protein
MADNNWPIDKRVPTLPTEVPARAPESDYAKRARPPDHILQAMRNAPHLDALNHTLAQPEALRTTAQCIFDLRFHDLIELCQKAIGNSDKLASIQPFDLATGLSGWAIEQLAKKHE